MKILIATNSCHLPQQYGGSEVSIDELTLTLIDAGHEVKVIASLNKNGWIYFFNRIKSIITDKSFPADSTFKYKVFRGWIVQDSIYHGVREVLEKFAPDVILIQGKNVLALTAQVAELNIPIVCSLVDLEKSNLASKPVIRSNIIYRANSDFTSNRLLDLLGIRCPVIPPLIRAARYKTQTTRQHITFVNPHPFKGCEIALKLAQLNPDVPFVFQEAWPLTANYKSELSLRLKTIPNIEYRLQTNDMKHLYSTTKILLMPSQYEEAWGRVANEAQLNGIPVIASDKGGIPQAVGDGGMVIAHDADINLWNNALRLLWSDENTYTSYSEKALNRYATGDLSVNHLLGLWLSAIEAVTTANTIKPKTSLL